MRIQFLLSIILLLFVNTNIEQNTEISGIYVGRISARKIILDSDGSFQILNPKLSGIFDMGVSTFSDTISSGEWYIDKDFLVLNSSKRIINRTLSLKVNETFCRNSDSLYLFINAPIEKTLSVLDVLSPNHPYNFPGRLVNYYLEVYSRNGRNYGDISNIPFGPEARFFVGDNTAQRIDSFRILIYPNTRSFDNTLSYSELSTIYYYPKDTLANCFNIVIPDLSIQFINYRRLVGEYVKIVSQKELMWENETFIKQ